MAPKRRRSDKFKIDEFCVDDDSEKSSEFNVPQKVMSSTAALRIPNNGKWPFPTTSVAFSVKIQ